MTQLETKGDEIMNKETYKGTKTKRIIKEPLELLKLVMYGDEANGEKDQAYEDLKHYLKEMK